MGSSLVSCFIPICAVFPSSFSCRGDGVDCPGHCWGVACPYSFPCVIATASSSCVPPSARISVSFVGPFRLSGWASRFPCRVRCRYQPRRGRGASRSHGVFSRSPLSARAVFPSSISHLFPYCDRQGEAFKRIRLTGHRGRRPFHMGHREERKWSNAEGWG